MEKFEFILNGKPVTYEGKAADRLLDILRNVFACTSVKCGCREGECGACAVILDGKLTNSCMVSVGAIAGGTVMTLKDTGKRSALP